MKPFYCLILVATTVACTRPSAFQVQQDLKSSVQSNQSAKTLSDWESSENHTETVFERFKSSKAESKDVCAGLSAMTDKELSLFEEEIKSSENQSLVTDCKKQLVDKLDTYWKEETRKVEASASYQVGSQFRFADNVQVRDVSQGYKAFTGDVGQKELVLTFDDGPHPQYTDQILEALEKVNAKAIFFSLGKNVRAYPSVLKRVAEGDHSIGSHSVTHKCIPAKTICAKNNGRNLTMDEALAEIIGGHQAVQDTLGWVDPFFRFPYGESSPELSQFLKDRSVGEFRWNIDSEDWKNRTPSEMIDFTMNQVMARNRGIVLFHDVHRGTAEALPTFLRKVYDAGFSIVVLHSANNNDRFNSKLAKISANSNALRTKALTAQQK